MRLPALRFAAVLVLALAAPVLARAGDEEKPVQEADVPKVVVEPVRKKYPTATVTEWSREVEDGKVAYEATLDVQGKDAEGKATVRHLDVLVSEAGAIRAEEERIAVEAIPEAVSKAIAKSRYAKARILRAERIVLEEKADAPRYEVLLDLEGTRHEVTFDAAGTVLEDEETKGAGHGDDDGAMK